MFILAAGGETYARLRFNVGPGGDVILPVEVDYSHPFAGSDVPAWQAEYDANIHAQREWDGRRPRRGSAEPSALSAQGIPHEWIDELEAMSPAERDMILADWGQEGVLDEEVHIHG